MNRENNNKSFSGFSKLNYQQRIKKLISLKILKPKDASLFSSKENLPRKIAEELIENFIGYFTIPLGMAVNFRIDSQDYIIPMAIEESSVVAAASKTAKWINENGRINTATLGNNAIGQIQIAIAKNFPAFKDIIEKNKKSLIDDVNQTIACNMYKRGGGLQNITIREIAREDGKTMAVIHLLINTCDAMGANVINQICEYLKPKVQNLTNEKVTMCILSNLSDEKLTKAEVIIHNVKPEIGAAIAEASVFAHHDPYRAATNNKGVLNGIDAVVIATGNDWRAVEAGVHAYAARSGKYSSITQWQMHGKDLIGTLVAPINVGIYGGVTRLHPIAELCLKILGVEHASELGRIIAAVGLVQNLGALKALTNEGICEGHMRLHISNLCLAAGAKQQEMNELKIALKEFLQKNKHVWLKDAKKQLQKIRQQHT